VFSRPDRVIPIAIANWYLLVSVKQAALMKKCKYWLARNQDNVSEWCDMSFRGLFYEKSEHYTNPAKHVLLVQSEPFHSFIEK
jgi:hypothetical protein